MSHPRTRLARLTLSITRLAKTTSGPAGDNQEEETLMATALALAIIAVLAVLLVIMIVSSLIVICPPTRSP